MSFLAPLYALAGLAIALPILFHLVRRKPKERLTFSSLMFLEPAPPRLTQHSRIEHWLLLLMRCLALLFLAAAFTRPFWNVSSETDVTTAGARRLFLIDTSASMKRDGMIERAIARAESMIQQSSLQDALAVYTFDRSTEPLVSIDQAISTPASQRQTVAMRSLAKVRATWHATDLGNALIQAADLLQTENDPNAEQASSINEIVLITDFQEGMMLDKLAQYAWPASCKIKLERIEPNTPGNAFASLLKSESGPDNSSSLSTKQSKPAADKGDANKVRIRLSNKSKASNSDFQLSWRDANGALIPGMELNCKVAAGSNTIVRMNAPTSDTAFLQLDGDHVDFDNRQYVCVRPSVQNSLVLIESATRVREQSLAYFVAQLPLSTSLRQVQVERREPGSNNPWPSPAQAPLIIGSHELTASDCTGLSEYLNQGGNVLWVWDEEIKSKDSQQIPDYTSGWARLTRDDSSRVNEAKVRNYNMLERVDFRHSLFSDLADSRFNDFTKVRFWSHRELKLPEPSNVQVLARFDDSSPAILTRSVGAGALWLMTSGWQPSQSQLALSSKFVPIMLGLFRIASKDVQEVESYEVGAEIAWQPGERIVDSEGNDLVGESSDSAKMSTARLSMPGIHKRIGVDGKSERFAVNLPETESLVNVADLERLERMGVSMSDQRPAERRAAAQRQLRAVELEAQQGWWRWLVMAVIGAVGLESILCMVRIRK